VCYHLFFCTYDNNDDDVKYKIMPVFTIIPITVTANEYKIRQALEVLAPISIFTIITMLAPNTAKDPQNFTKANTSIRRTKIQPHNAAHDYTPL